MSSYTFLRVEVDSSVVERVLGLTPGVEVVDEFDTDSGERAPSDERERPTDQRTEDPDDDGLVSRATPDGDLLEEESAVRKYGLLGVGLSFIMLGFATIGIWWYRRHNSGGSEETESDTEFEPSTETRTTAVTTETTAVEHERPSSPTETDETAETDDESLSIVRPSDDSDTAEDAGEDGEDAVETDEAPGRTDDRDDVEWTTKWDQKPRESTEEPESVEPDAGPDEPSPRTTESVDVAPLLGVAFIAISGAIVRWLQGGDQ